MDWQGSLAAVACRASPRCIPSSARCSSWAPRAAHSGACDSAASAGHTFVLPSLFVFFASVIVPTQRAISALCTLLLLVIIKIQP